MSKPFRHRLLVWLWDGVAAAIGGVVTTIVSTSAVNIVNAFMPGAVREYSPRQILMTLLVSAAVSWAMYVQKRRLPPIDDDDTYDGTTPLPPIQLRKGD